MAMITKEFHILTKKLYLGAPPPVARVHLVIDVGVARVTHIVSFGYKCEVLSKFGVAVERSNAI